ncbi:MAG: flagellar protein FlaG [Agathobacter sp.]|nr:flagellar protein FlaG [Agathobacter sp.]MBQ6812860.1 flagellar protein FlaG [Agathobacter sp.]
MGIEAIKGAGMTYQGSSASPEIKAEAAHKVEVAEAVQVSDSLAKDTMAMNTKDVSGEGTGQGAPNPEQTKAKIKKAVEEINKKANNSEAVFGIHEDTNRVTIKIVDKQTKEVIKEFPPDKTLDMISRVWEMAGLMVDEKR